MLTAAALVALATFAHTSGFSPLALVLLAAGLAAVWLGDRFDLDPPRTGATVVGILVVIFMIGPEAPEGHHFFEPAVGPAFRGGLAAAATLVLLLFRRCPGNQIYLRVAVALGLMMAAGVVREAVPYAFMVAAEVVCLLLFLRTGHRAAALTPGSLAAALLVAALASALALSLAWSETQLSMAVELFTGSSGSSIFSPNTDLTWANRRQGSTKMVAQVWADKPPVYMTGIRYQTYNQGRWLANDARVQLERQPDAPYFRGYNYLCGATPDQPQTLRVQLSSLPAISLLHPVGTRVVGIEVPTLRRDPLGTLYLTPQVPFDGGYQMAYGEPLGDDEPALLQACLQLPDDCPPEVFELAHQFIETAPTAEAAVLGLQSYFQENFKYGFGRKPRKGENIVEVFLREKPPAHCEIFATSMAMILRAGHIPTRYVNGFLVAERSRFGNYWVTRDRDAHAWVEAYLPGHGWVTADPTPPSALASPPVPVWRETVEWLTAGVKRLFNQLRQSPTSLLTSWPFALVVLYLLFRFGRRFRLRLPSRSSRPVAPELSRLQALLARCEKAQAAEGRQRDPSLTVLEWAESLPDDQVRQFLANYSAVRYARAVPYPAQVDDLEKLLP